MEQLSERFRHAMSRQEMERRWGLLRHEMEKQELDCLILHNYDNFLGGYTRYITDIPIGNYPSTVLFHREDETTYIGTPHYMDRAVQVVAENIRRYQADEPLLYVAER